jgi:hypothetical protein
MLQALRHVRDDERLRDRLTLADRHGVVAVASSRFPRDQLVPRHLAIAARTRGSEIRGLKLLDHHEFT